MKKNPPAFLTPDPIKEGCQVRLLLDSGAFSAYTRGVQIDVTEYAQYILDHADLIDTAINLDVIPGTLGGPEPTAEDKEAAAEEGWENLMYLEREIGHTDVKLMPVFHIGEDIKWLHKMIDHGFTYIGLGGIAKVKTSVRKRWLDSVFHEICDDAGYPKVRLHGLGVTTINLIQRYPWYSVDSTSWVLTGAFGSVMIPPMKNGEYDFSADPMKLSISSDSPEANKTRGSHYNNLSVAEQLYVRTYLEWLGKSLEEVAGDVYARAFVNSSFFKFFEENVEIRPFKQKLSKRGFL